MRTAARLAFGLATCAILALAGCSGAPGGDGTGGDTPGSERAPYTPLPQDDTTRGVMVTGCNEAAISAAAPSSASTFLSRAYNWVDRAVPYCECVTSYSTPYRADCSGYVSYIWGLPAPGNTTYSFAGGPWDNGDSVRITWSDLTIGDALNFPGDPSAGTGHIMLFAGWLDSAHTHFCAIEEYNYGHPASITSHYTSDPGSWWGGSGTLGSIFLPIRKAGYVPTPPTAPWAASWASQSYPSDMTSGDVTAASLSYKNEGTNTWDGSTHLGTTVARDRASAFADPSWLAPDRPAAVSASTPPGKTGHFDFVLHAPEVAKDTTYVEHWGLVQEGVTWFGPADSAVWFKITVHPRFTAKLAAQSADTLDMVSGSVASAEVRLKNTGSTTWDTTGTRLGTVEPQDRASAFYDPVTWINPSRPAAVSASTAPGGVGTFDFTLVAPEVQTDTTYVEHFGAVQEGTSWISLDHEVTLTITVHPRGEVAATPAPVAAAANVGPLMSGGCSAAPGAPAGGLLGLLLLVAVAGLARRAAHHG